MLLVALRFFLEAVEGGVGGALLSRTLEEGLKALFCLPDDGGTASSMLKER